jgi:hypothetical protein
MKPLNPIWANGFFYIYDYSGYKLLHKTPKPLHLFSFSSDPAYFEENYQLRSLLRDFNYFLAFADTK